MSNREEPDDRDYLEGIECGAGCTEIWEHLAEQRRDEADDVADD